MLGFAFAFGWTPCIGPILTTVLAFAAASDKIGRGVLLLAAYSAGLAVPFVVTALGISRFFKFYQSFRKYLHVVELFSGALLLFIGGLVFVNKLTWLTGKLGFLDSLVLWLENVLVTGKSGPIFWSLFGLLVVVLIGFAVLRSSKTLTLFPVRKAALVVSTLIAIIAATYFADKATRKSTQSPAGPTSSRKDKSIGMPMPELTLKDVDGKDVSFSNYKGKVVLVNFWATWCIPCREEIPWLIEMQQMYGAKGFTVVGLAMDEAGKSVVAPFVAKKRFTVNGHQLPMSYPILIGNDDAAEKFGGLLGYPSSVLISRDGKQIQHVTGLISYQEITTAIKSQL